MLTGRHRSSSNAVGKLPSLGKGKLGLLPLVMTIFFCVSGGPYGLETVVQSGRGMALILIVVVGIIWALPIALLSAELGSAIPEEGGYYEWVKRGVGQRAGFACAWLTYLYSCVDVAIYPVLFVKYLGALGFDLSDPVANTAIRLAMVVPLTWLNIKGAVSSGNAALLFALALLVPFVVMLGMGIIPSVEHFGQIVTPLTNPGISTTAAAATGLFVIMWNYLGWDSISTISREMKDAPRIFPKALMIGLPLVILFLSASRICRIKCSSRYLEMDRRKLANHCNRSGWKIAWHCGWYRWSFERSRTFRCRFACCFTHSLRARRRWLYASIVHKTSQRICDSNTSYHYQRDDLCHS